jgi:hypothetical protein
MMWLVGGFAILALETAAGMAYYAAKIDSPALGAMAAAMLCLSLIAIAMAAKMAGA